ncbi:AraC family transcriptional regulator [Enterococcus pseudoavium]|uniref:AraC family transcriptional regulator n=1 Tax=Enterococcus pseudoavium TaxID=44007 RepID=A0AAE4HYY9_9ENTE|nr:AraC family transcriptional regulator [Enterococcus pseudoavium]MDT2735523.1 AraC family transcriptional regulator [Enterococcus pseudoavium]MDT2754488.1 AraC family transcriptional regulator [Enterococcus pseudoavium]MDT2769456.1 AraC family transcriptional regulator [Enterococcus pseudoavium]REC31052.1 AraC family transcriptional regulator [Enterococcus pseudoavium]
MEWLDQFNNSIAYVEENLTTTIDLERAAQLAQCSSYHYQRMFSYIAGVTLGEYIRRRKMSLAGVDLQRGEKVIDVANKYGYDSPTSFNRVFKSVHQITPQAAKQAGVKLTSYPMLTFKITVKGVNAMEYQLIDKAAFKVTGVSLKLAKDMEKAQKEIPQFWNEVSTSGQLQQLLPLMDQANPGVMGISLMTAETEENWEYAIAVASEEVPADFQQYEIPAAKWAIFSGTGPMPGAIQALQRQIFQEWLPTSGFEYAELPDIELYLDANPTDAHFQVWLPVRAK